MAQITVRQLDPELIRLLKVRAARSGRSAEAEVRAILEQTLRRNDDFWQRAAELRRATAGRSTSNSTDLIRADRDRDNPW